MLFALMLTLALAATSSAYLQFGAELHIQSGDVDIEVPGYSVPDIFDWNGDTIPDLIVGEGGGVYIGKVRVYLNQGSAQTPLFDGFFYAQSAAGGDLAYPGG
jgi:hypothetical protein